MSRNVEEAVVIRAPRRTGDATRWAPQVVTTFSGASTAEHDTGVDDADDLGTYVTFSFLASVYICFGVTGLGAASVTDMYYAPGTYDFKIFAADRYFRIWGTADGVAHFYISQR